MGDKKTNYTRWILLIVGIVVLAVMAYAFISNWVVEDLDTSAFFEKAGVNVNIDKGEIEITDGTIAKIEVSGYNLYGYTKSVTYGNKIVYTKSYKTSYGRNTYSEYFGDAILDQLSLHGVIIDYDDPNANSLLSQLLMPAMILIIGLILVFVFMRQANGSNKQAIDFGKTKARITKDVKVRFSDVAGAEEEKQELKEIVDFLKNPRKYTTLGARVPKGVLLVGNPGTGKTLFAKAVAGEANVPFFSISGSDFVEMFVGVGASRVRDLFATAKKNMPCIIFIDEIDAVGRHRGAGLGGGNDEREQTLNQLLVQMDGFEANDGIVIMAATNRADILDPALLRPGRFDRQIYVHMPDVKGREAILKVHARNKPMAKDVNFKTLARLTAGFSGADLANLLNEAAILAAREDKSFITNLHLYEAIDKVVIGPQKKSRVISEVDKRITAYHESGHAILARLLPNCDPVQEVSIIPRGMAAGYTMTRPDNDSNHIEKSKMLDDICMTLGGRVAEELVIKDISAGASNDIQVLTNNARRMVTQWGMSDVIGPISYSDGEQVFIGRDMQTKVAYSEEMAKRIDGEIERIIREQHEKATKLLSENRDKLDVMARLLVERETIYQEEVDLIMEGKSFKEIIEIIGENSDDKIEKMINKEIKKDQAVEEEKTEENPNKENIDKEEKGE